MGLDPDAASPPALHLRQRPIGQLLVERGLLTPPELERALAQQRQSGGRLGEILVERGAITRLELASVLGEQWNEAGAHLRAVVPVRAEGLSESDELAGGEQLLELVASLQAAVARLEELGSTPAGGSAVSHPEVDARSARRSRRDGLRDGAAR